MLVNLGSAILNRVFKARHNPILIDGMIDSRQMMIIPQDPSARGAKPIYRSDNEREGIEFTWSVWINIDDYSYKKMNINMFFIKVIIIYQHVIQVRANPV